tara:strand:- start:1405 stop:1677 length:273 start_codon:yes stop_codon:yes gene_type:complete
MPHPYFDNTSAEQQLRDERFRLLDLTDWTQTVDCPLSDEKKEECRVYRQALRDLPANSSPQLDERNVLTNVTWPEPPVSIPGNSVLIRYD